MVLDTADIGSLSEKDRIRYESDLKNYMDTMSCIEFATETGREEGREEGKSEEKLKIAKSLKADGMDYQMISKHTGLNISEIETL